MFRKKSDQKEIADILNYQFKDEKLLLRALTRQSALNEGQQLIGVGSFQRLEFLGDKVLNLVVSDVLAEQHDTWDESQLTQETARFVHNKGPLADVARRLRLGDFLIMGQGEEKHNNARDNRKVLSDAMEALIGALWLDTKRDYSFLKNFIVEHWTPLGLLPVDKSALIQTVSSAEISKEEKVAAIEKFFQKNDISADLADEFFNLAINDEIEIVKLALKKKVTKTSLDKALIECIQHKDISKVALLLEHGANPNTVHERRDEDELCCSDPYTRSALQLAVEYQDKNSIEIATRLLAAGADVNWQGGIVKQTIGPSHSKSKVIESPLLTTALHLVVLEETDLQHKIERITLLLKNNANPNLQNAHGDTPLHILIGKYELYPNREILIIDVIKMLLEANADLNLQDKKGDSVLHIALKGFIKAIRFFEVDQPTSFLYFEIVGMLVEKGADKQLKNTAGLTPQKLLETTRIPVSITNAFSKAGIRQPPDSQEQLTVITEQKNDKATVLAPKPVAGASLQSKAIPYAQNPLLFLPLPPLPPRAVQETPTEAASSIKPEFNS
jgi:ribonuclease-3